MEVKNNLNNYVLTNDYSEGCFSKCFRNCFNIKIYTELKKPIYILNRLICIYTLLYMLELIGGIYTKSLIIISESSFLLTEIFNLSYNSLHKYFNKIETNYSFTFGYYRVESIFIIFNIFFIWIISITQIIISIIKIINLSKIIQPVGTLIFSIICFIINLSSLIVLHNLIGIIIDFFSQMRNDNPYKKYEDEEKDNNLSNNKNIFNINDNYRINIELENVNDNIIKDNESRLDASVTDEKTDNESENDNKNENKNHSLLTLDNREIKANIKQVEKKIIEFSNDKIIINKNNAISIFFPYEIKILRSFFVFGISLIIFLDKNKRFYIIDPLYTIILSFFLIILTFQIFKHNLFILLESSESDNCPSPNDIEKYISINQPNTLKIHNIHIWSLNDNIHCISFHIIIDDDTLRNNINYNISIGKDILVSITNDLKEKFGFKFVTIQIENGTQYLNLCKEEN